MTAPHDPHESMTGASARWRRRLCPWVVSVAVIVAAILLVYSVPWRVSSKEDLPKLVGMLDHWHYYVPMGYFLDASIHNGEIPLWNPLTFCGAPFAGNPQSCLFYPPNVLRSCLTFHPTPMKTHIGLVLMLACHIVLAGVGTFFFAREHKLSYGASFVAAFVFIFSAGFIRRGYANMFITSMAWIPLELLLLRRAFSEKCLRRRLYYAVGAGLVFGLALLAGSPHMALLMSMTVAAYGVFYRLFNL